MRSVCWRPRAHLDRESIAIYLAMECGNPKAALKAIQKIDEAIDKIRQFPDMGGHLFMEGLDTAGYRTVQVNPYVIYYQFDSAEVTIFRVLHQRRNIDAAALISF